MRISIADLQALLDYMKRRSTDIALNVNIDGSECTVSFGDVDGQIITATLYSLESARMARVTSTEQLIQSLRKLNGII